jgi:periplasmic glucans biosynthesis protein
MNWFHFQRLAMHAWTRARPINKAVWFSGIAAVMLSISPVHAASPFGFDDVAREAAQLAARPFEPAPPLPARLAALEYDEYRRIRFLPARALWRDKNTPFQMHFFPLGRSAVQPLRLHEIVDGKAKPLPVKAADFDFAGVLPTPAPGDTVPVAGWRLMHPLNKPKQKDEVIVFLGASYFRALGRGQLYGASARGLAIDPVGGRGEEFPSFTAYWFETPKARDKSFVVYALLDGPSVVGAFRFVVTPGATTVVDTKARFILRTPVSTFAVAPLTSMFLHAENQPAAHEDFRPEVHDSDGLLVHSGDGEWIWRPLTHPKAPFVSSFAAQSPRGFGLMQRDRAFTSYEDIEARYDARPSVWVEPVGDWGAGRVELLQLPIPDETHDNIVAYWVASQAPKVGEPVDLSWRLHWRSTHVEQRASDASKVDLARVAQSRRGYGWQRERAGPERQKYVVDFVGAALPRQASEGSKDAIKAVASGNPNVRIVRVNAYPHPVSGGWRATIEFDRLDARQPVELRLALTQSGRPVSETWAYALAPQ